MLSIIIPVYNVEAYVEKCIKSIQNQSFKDWELILVDDGSTDGSGKICDEFSRNDNRIKVIHQENQGVSDARNKGLELSNGEFVFFVDADDWLDQGCLEHMIPRDGIDICVCGIRRVYSNEKESWTTYVDQWPRKKAMQFDTKDIYYDVFNAYGTVANKVIRKSIIGNTRFLKDQSYGEDMIFFVNIIGNARKATINKYPYYNYFCTRQGNTFSSYQAKYAFDSIKSLKEVYTILEQHGYATCGVNKIRIAIRDIQRKTKEYNDKRINDKCFETLCMPGAKNIFAYLLDRKVCRVKHKILFLYLIVYFFVCKTKSKKG